jgi:two-component system chemotaxis response regulator CheY
MADTDTPTFMVVDDDIIVHLYYEGVLKELGADAHMLKASDGGEALDLLITDERPLPAVIFLDITMPGVDGYGFLEVFDKKYPDSDTTIIMVSSSRLEDDKRRCKAYKCVKEFITKPPQAEDIERICLMHGAL